MLLVYTIYQNVQAHREKRKRISVYKNSTHNFIQAIY